MFVTHSVDGNVKKSGKGPQNRPTYNFFNFPAALYVTDWKRLAYRPHDLILFLVLPFFRALSLVFLKFSYFWPRWQGQWAGGQLCTPSPGPPSPLTVCSCWSEHMTHTAVTWLKFSWPDFNILFIVLSLGWTYFYARLSIHSFTLWWVLFKPRVLLKSSARRLLDSVLRNLYLQIFYLKYRTGNKILLRRLQISIFK